MNELKIIFHWHIKIIKVLLVKTIPEKIKKFQKNVFLSNLTKNRLFVILAKRNLFFDFSIKRKAGFCRKKIFW